MKRQKVMTLMATATLGALALVPMSALAVDGGEYQTNGAIQFAPNTNPTNPVDPTNQIRINQLRQLIQLIRQGLSQGQQVRYPLTMHLAYLWGTNDYLKNMTYYAETQKYKDNLVPTKKARTLFKSQIIVGLKQVGR